MDNSEEKTKPRVHEDPEDISTYLPSPSPSPAKTARSRKTVASKNAAEKKKGVRGVKPQGDIGAASGRKTGSWTKKEVRQLWDALGLVPPKGINWSEVAVNVDGRDKLSCQNKWRYDLLPKIQAFIDSLGD